MDVTGAGRTERSIRDMVGPHSGELNQMGEWSARTETIPGGIRLTVTANDPADAKTVAPHPAAWASSASWSRAGTTSRTTWPMARGDIPAGPRPLSFPLRSPLVPHGRP